MVRNVTKYYKMVKNDRNIKENERKWKKMEENGTNGIKWKKWY
jgi:hypothetical protein